MAAIKFYGMTPANNKKSAVARASNGFNRYALWDLIETIESADQWGELRLILDDGVVTDLPPTELIGRVCSPKLVEVINQFRPNVLWLPVILQRGTTEYTYYFMHFVNVPDVMDHEKTVYAGGNVFTAHISLAKAAHLPVICFRPLGKITFVRGDVRDAIQKAGCMGIEFEMIASS